MQRSTPTLAEIQRAVISSRFEGGLGSMAASLEDLIEMFPSQHPKLEPELRPFVAELERRLVAVAA